MLSNTLNFEAVCGHAGIVSLAVVPGSQTVITIRAFFGAVSSTVVVTESVCLDNYVRWKDWNIHVSLLE